MTGVPGTPGQLFGVGEAEAEQRNRVGRLRLWGPIADVNIAVVVAFHSVCLTKFCSG